MTLVITINGAPYLPLRALPHVSSGLLDESTVIHMISDPEGFCDHQYDQILSPMICRPDGRLLPVSSQGFAALRTPFGRKPRLIAATLPPGMLVRLDAAKEKFNLIVNEIMPKARSQFSPRQAVWDVSPPLTVEERRHIFEDLPPSRSNSVPALLAQLRQAYERIKSHCAEKGVTLDDMALPGNSRDWTPIVHKLAPLSRYRSNAVLKEHLKTSGLRWHQGRQPAVVREFIDAIGDLTAA